jgi:hypothetical protein
MPESREGDACIGLMPVGGGTLRGRLCPAPLGSGDTLTVLDRPAVSAGGRIAYVVSMRRSTDQRGWRSRDLFVGSLVAPRAPVRLGPVASAEFSTISSLRWLDEERLVFVGEREESSALGPGAFELVPVGRAIAVRDARPGAASLIVPGTTSPTSVTPADAGAVFATVAGDTRIFRVDLATGAAVVVHDFGAAGVPRDLHAAGGRLAAVVGGVLQRIVLPDGRLAQRDSGGKLFVLDLASGTATQLGDPLPPGRIDGSFALYRRPALAPDARTIVVEGYEARARVISEGPPTLRDTILLTTGDLWRFDDL